VVALSKHWEAFYFPRAGYAITRGWYRQEDAIHNTLFLPPRYGAGRYVAWLRSMGVRYVFLPHAPLDFSSAGEPAILAGSPAFTVAAQLPNWTVYQLRSPGSSLARRRARRAPDMSWPRPPVRAPAGRRRRRLCFSR